MRTILNRLYGDYMMPSRLSCYEDFIRLASSAGYTHTSVRQFIKSLPEWQSPDKKVILHRHDIDTDVRTARKIFYIEKKLNIKSSYYFRLSTLDFELMNEIEEYGSEASYHYEELATFAKKHNIKDPAEIRLRLPEIRDDFLANFTAIEGRLGRKITTVASHGDFANRRLKLSNTEILSDQKLRERCGIECESYDHALLDNFDIYIADRPYPTFYCPTSPFDAIGRYNKICFLTHPVHWETNWRENTRGNLLRLYEGLKWQQA